MNTNHRTVTITASIIEKVVVLVFALTVLCVIAVVFQSISDTTTGHAPSTSAGTSGTSVSVPAPGTTR